MTGIAKDYIDERKPVILAISNNNGTSHHAVVAYDYNSSGQLLSHFGWSASSTHDPLWIHGYSYIYYMAVLDFDNMPVVVSNNYKLGDNYLDSNGNLYVPHQHRVDFWNVSNRNQHSGNCTLCGTLVRSMHSYVNGTCSHCGYDNPNGGGIIFNERKEELQ